MDNANLELGILVKRIAYVTSEIDKYNTTLKEMNVRDSVMTTFYTTKISTLVDELKWYQDEIANTKLQNEEDELKWYQDEITNTKL